MLSNQDWSAAPIIDKKGTSDLQIEPKSEDY